MLAAFILGLIQGVSEFLPVSSSGHLALASLLFGVNDAGLTFNVLLHVGTLLATVIVLRQRLAGAIIAGIKALAAPALFRTTPGGQDALFVILASIPTALLGFALRDVVEKWIDSPLVLGCGFLATAALLIFSQFARSGAIEHPSYQVALLLGLAQGIAVLPGVSRSGATITCALFLGIARTRAFELSMLMSVPAVLGAALFELPKMISDIPDWPAALLGAAVACGSGILAISWLRNLVIGGRFSLFALWVLPLAVATLAMARSWPSG